MILRKISVVVDHVNLECDVCGSTDILETAEGYVCRQCAVVLKLQKLQYDMPYNRDVIQYARGLGRTKIGTKRERSFSPISKKLQRLHKYNSHLTHEEVAHERARKEVLRILSRLDLSSECEPYIMEKFKDLRSKLGAGTKFRSAEKLASILTFIGLKLKNIAINSRDIIEVSSLTDEEFRSFFTQVAHYLPEYAKRNRQGYISQKLLEITENLGLEMPFYFLSKKILYRFWESIKNTTDNVIAGFCAGITALCNYKEQVKINTICGYLGIRMSTIQFQVKHRLFDHYNLEGFTTLVRSSDLLKRFLIKLGVVKHEVDILKEQEQDNGIIKVQLGNARQIFNPDNEYYLFGITDKAEKAETDKLDKLTIGYLEVYTNDIFSQKPFKREGTRKWFDLILGEYYPSKGPPGIG
jgi:transcription initiation factor TFIIIB Brf1 subunit/transcription initiation factor TFIIB